MAKTGGHFSRCNVGSVEAHNERTQAYLDGVKAAGLPLYFFQNLTVNNTHWMSDRQEFAGKTCAQIFESLKQLYTEKTGQAPQLKDRTRINKKTGKEYTVAGWSPIREAVIPIKEDTTVEDFKPVFAWLRLNGLEPIRLDLHKDEGYEDEETGEKKMNYHGHLVVCWVDLQTGKTANLKKDKMSEFNQKILPEALGMEAGESKAITGKEHLTPAAQRAKAEVERLEAKAVAVEEKVQHLEERHDQLERENTRLQVVNTTKAAAVAVGQSIAGVFGQSKKDKTIQQLQDTIAHEPERTAAAVTEWKEKYEIQCDLNHRKNNQIKELQTTTRQQSDTISRLNAKVSALDKENVSLKGKLTVMDKIEKAMTDCCNWAAKCAKGSAVWAWVYEKFEALCDAKGINEEWKNGRHSVAADVWLGVVDPDNGGRAYGQFTEKQQQALSDELHKAADHPELGRGRGVTR